MIRYGARVGNKWFDGVSFRASPDDAKIYDSLRAIKTRITQNGPYHCYDAFDAALAAGGGEIVAFNLVPNAEASIPIIVENIREELDRYGRTAFSYAANYRRDK